jgi:DNA-binding MarR family transcriptional regulator
MVTALPSAAGFTKLARERTEELVPGTDQEAMDVVLGVIRLANRLVGDLETEVHRPMGWSWAGFRILFTLWVAGPLEPRALAHLSAVTRASISSVLNTLERDGLVERRRESSDRRMVTVVLTTSGRRQTAEAFRRQNERERQWVSALEPAEQRELARLLHRLLEHHPPGDDG